MIWMCFCSAFGGCPKASQPTIWQLSSPCSAGSNSTNSAFWSGFSKATAIEPCWRDWRRLSARPAARSPEPADAARPLVEVTSRRIWRLYRRLVDHAMAIDDKTPADAIHQVRIEAKKLRYMIDATRSLHDRRDLDRIIDSLKRVQSVLGDFNDAQVQERHLLDSGRALLEAGAGELRGASHCWALGGKCTQPRRVAAPTSRSRIVTFLQGRYPVRVPPVV